MGLCTTARRSTLGLKRAGSITLSSSKSDGTEMYAAAPAALTPCDPCLLRERMPGQRRGGADRKRCDTAHQGGERNDEGAAKPKEGNVKQDGAQHWSSPSADHRDIGRGSPLVS